MYGHMEKYVTFCMIICNNKMQPYFFSFLAVNDESVESCMWNLVWRLWSVQPRFISSLRYLDFCLHHNIHSSAIYLATFVLSTRYFLSIEHLCTMSLTLLSQFIELCWLIMFYSKFAGKLQFIHICLGVRSDYEILVFWKFNMCYWH